MIHQVTLPNGEQAEHKEGEPLLTLLKENGLYSECQSGFCGACRTKVICGSVRYISEPLAKIDDDEVLPCCCTPTSNIAVQF